MSNDTEETSMARTGSTVPKPEVASGEPEVDFMSDAPAERPYADAVSAEQRKLLFDAGIPLAEAAPVE